MAKDKSVRLQVNVRFTDGGEAVAPLAAYAYTHQGLLIGSGNVEKGSATIDVPAELDGRTLEVVIGPRVEQGEPAPARAALSRAGAYVKTTRLIAEKPVLDLSVAGALFPRWCFCFVRGRLVKRYTLPDGTTSERPVCNARVHICEVDRIPIILPRIPDPDIFRLRDDLLEKLRVVRIPPIPDPDPGPLRQVAGAASLPLSRQIALSGLATAHSADDLRKRLVDWADLILIHLCELRYLWSYFVVDEITTVYADHDGHFSSVILHDCRDQPDLYFWVEQFQGGAWHTVYRPSIGCGTHWNYVCGTEVVLNLPNAVPCEEPGYDVPPGVTLFVLPWAIASTPIWGKPAGMPPAPAGWLRGDGFVDYYSGPGLGWLYDAPFGGTLNFIHDDSWYIPSAGIRYYRYSWRAHSVTPNTGADDASWTPIATSLARGYRMEYSDRLPTYQAYPVGPVTVGGHSGLFEFKPQVPPALPTDPATVVVREWVSGNLSEVAASWNTVAAAPPLSDTHTVDSAGAYDIKIEVFDGSGVLVGPGPATFRFLGRNADSATTRLASADEVVAGAYVMQVQVDNNGVAAALPQPSIGGVAASDDCGFLRYNAGDQVHLQFHASHPNDRAVFTFGVTRGSNGLASASTAPPYVEVAAPSATPYTKIVSDYQHNFAPVDLVGTCVNAAFAGSLGVYGKATNGEQRLGYDAARLIAFALAQRTGP